MTSGNSPKLLDKNIIIPFVLITSCFAWWGLANNMTDTLLAAFKKIKSMSDFQTSLIQMAFYGAYFCFAIPAALFIKRFSYKSGILLGLALFICGGLLFYPASITQEYWHFLVALYILAGGLSILETSANPYILEIGDKRTATQRLNLAQSFNPLGSITGVLISMYFILPGLRDLSKSDRLAMSSEDLLAVQTEELSAIMGPYVVVSFVLIIVWILIASVKMPKSKDSHQVHVLQSFRRLLSNSDYLLGVVAQFFYVGAQICVWSFTIRYVMQELDINESDASAYYLAAIVTFSSSRFLGTWLLSYFRPTYLLISFTIIAGLSTLVVVFFGGLVSVIFLIAISMGMSIMFPTIFGMATNTISTEDMKIAGSGMIMAIVGGAVLTPIQGLVSDSSGISSSYLVPFICFVVILLFAINHLKSNTKTA